ncbi:MAG: hypothetical protein AAFY19_00325 [Pseudomonadota bacterium]
MADTLPLDASNALLDNLFPDFSNVQIARIVQASHITVGRWRKSQGIPVDQVRAVIGCQLLYAKQMEARGMAAAAEHTPLA